MNMPCESGHHTHNHHSSCSVSGECRYLITVLRADHMFISLHTTTQLVLFLLLLIRNSSLIFNNIVFCSVVVLNFVTHFHLHSMFKHVLGSGGGRHSIPYIITALLNICNIRICVVDRKDLAVLAMSAFIYLFYLKHLSVQLIH